MLDYKMRGMMMKSYIFWHDDRVEEVRGGNLVDEVSDSLRDVIKKLWCSGSNKVSNINYFHSEVTFSAALYLLVKSSFLVRTT